MKDNDGFITIMALAIMSIILISSLYLMYTYSLEYMIVTSTVNSMQSYYFSEGKVYLILNHEKYLDSIMPHIRQFVKDIYIKIIKGISIQLDYEDLFEGDKNNIVSANIYHDYDGRIILELKTKSTYRNVTREVVSKITVINELFELGIPVVSVYSLDDKKQHMFDDYMNYLKNNLEIPELDSGIYGICLEDYEKIKLIRNSNDYNIECYRNGIKYPVEKKIFASDKVFLLVKQNNMGPNVYIVDLNGLEDFKLAGIIYVEGDLIICSDFEFNGILIVNGSINVESSANMKVNGILLYKGEESIEDERLQLQYDFANIRKYGIYLPEFIKLDIRSIKSN